MANSEQTILTLVNVAFPFQTAYFFLNVYVLQKPNAHHIQNIYFTFAFMEMNHKSTHLYVLIQKAQKHFHFPVLTSIDLQHLRRPVKAYLSCCKCRISLSHTVYSLMFQFYLFLSTL